VDRQFRAEGGASWFDDLSVSVEGASDPVESGQSKDLPPKWSNLMKPSGEGQDRLPSPAGDGKNLLPDGNLESGNIGQPEDWSRLENQWGETKWAVTPQKIHVLSIANTLDARVGWRSAPVNVSGGMEMNLSLQLMMNYSSNVRMGLDWLDADHNSLGVTLSGNLEGNGTWREFWMSAPAPAPARFVRVLVTQDKSSGTSLFTSFVLTAKTP
jgi:hypothetical protein